MLMTSPEKLQAALLELQPTHIAVAYLGSAWREYLPDLSSLEEIVVSPTIGSNPNALKELLGEADRHGFKVLLSENLHAKLFIGQSACLIGSPNLSQNGFGGGLNEAAVVLEGDHQVQNAMLIFDRLKVDAIGDRSQQELMIKQLREKWLQARKYNTFPKESGDQPRVTLDAWSMKDQRVIVTWYYTEGDFKFKADRIKAEIPEYDERDHLVHFADYMDFAGDDDICEGDWLLCWAAMNSGQPRRNKNYPPVWMHVNKIIPNGADNDNEYPLLAVTFNKDAQEGVTPPFVLDEVIERLVPDLLDSGEYERLKLTDDHVWRAKDVAKDNRRFLNELQQAYRKATTE